MSQILQCYAPVLAPSNTRSLVLKNREIIHSVVYYDIDFAMFQTKIDHTVSDSEVSVAGYNIVRKDRNMDMVGACLCIFVNMYQTLNVT